MAMMLPTHRTTSRGSEVTWIIAARTIFEKLF